MPRPVLRTFFICLLLLAVPFQGFAAAGVVLCAVSHQRTVEAGGDRHSPCHPMSSDGVGHLAAIGDPAAPGADGVPGPCDSMHSPGNGSCSACAACCVGAVLLPPQVTIAAVAPGSADFPPPAMLGPSFQADVPIRPPRSA